MARVEARNDLVARFYSFPNNVQKKNEIKTRFFSQKKIRLQTIACGLQLDFAEVFGFAVVDSTALASEALNHCQQHSERVAQSPPLLASPFYICPTLRQRCPEPGEHPNASKQLCPAPEERPNNQ